MSATVAKLINPATYTQAWAFTSRRAQAYYHPLLRDNSVTPLWHAMLGIGLVMYSGTYISRVYPEVQEAREVKRVAVAEYYEKHGGAPHH